MNDIPEEEVSIIYSVAVYTRTSLPACALISLSLEFICSYALHVSHITYVLRYYKLTVRVCIYQAREDGQQSLA